MSSSKAFLLITLIAFCSLFLNVHSQSIGFTIDDFACSSAKNMLTFERDAYVPSGVTFIRLIRTNSSGHPAQFSVGRALYKDPITFWQTGQQMSFAVTLQFNITTFDDKPADGMSFFIVPVGSVTPTGGQGHGLGIFGALTSNSPIFAIEFDIFYNNDIGIDIGNRPSKNTTRLEDDALNKVVTALINYEATSRRITVLLTFGSKTSKLSYVYDLKTYLPQQVQIGISAATGTNIAFFDVLKWYFSGTLVADNSLEETYVKQYV